MDFTTQPYLSLETYRKNGEPMRTPVWFVRDGDKIYIRTVANSGKVKRLRAKPRLRVALCDRVGNVTGRWVAATGREVRDDPALYERVDRLLDEKYGEIKRQLAAQAAAEGRVYTILEIRLDE
ncbi:MAG: PPOX class F420-dependent oxidoreductase [Anaerolineales bacterium]